MLYGVRYRGMRLVHAMAGGAGAKRKQHCRGRITGIPDDRGVGDNRAYLWAMDPNMAANSSDPVPGHGEADKEPWL